MRRSRINRVRSYIKLEKSVNDKLDQIVGSWNCTVSDYIELIGYQLKYVEGYDIMNEHGAIPHGILSPKQKTEQQKDAANSNAQFMRITVTLPIEAKKRISSQAYYRGITTGRLITEHIERDHAALMKNLCSAEILRIPVSNDLMEKIWAESEKEDMSFGDYIDKAVRAYQNTTSKPKKERKAKKASPRQRVHLKDNEEQQVNPLENSSGFNTDEYGQLTFGF